MYLAVDIGGSKTLMAAFSDEGGIVKEHKFATNHDYQQFLKDIAAAYRNFSDQQYRGCCVAVPGLVDRNTGVVKRFGNLPWQNVSLGQDIATIFQQNIIIENDANLAALSEALLVGEKYKKAVYVTLSTGIGAKLILDGRISQEVPDTEAGFMMFEHDGRLQEWEEFASGQAIVQKYGRKASEIEDPVIWQAYSKAVATGLFQLMVLWYPEVIIIGGGVGAHFEKFATPLNQELARYQSHMVDMVPIIKAKRPEEAVIYGCYELARLALTEAKDAVALNR